jgi:phosphotransferase system enzyme I (PtsI)
VARAILFGTSISPGIAIGFAHFIHSVQQKEYLRLNPDEAPAEQAFLRAATDNLCAALQQTIQNVPPDMAEYRDVIAAQIVLARDPKLLGSALARIEDELICAAWALDRTVDTLCAQFRGMEDPYLRDRAQDIRTVGLRLREYLSGQPKPQAPDVPCILVAGDLSPADIIELNLQNIQGILTVEGGSTSHTSILARSLRIPALVNVTGLLDVSAENCRIILDGIRGHVLFDPDVEELVDYRTRQTDYANWEKHCESMSRLPAEMSDGARVIVRANLERQGDLAAVRESGAEGIGLYRTEYAYLSGNLPAEDDLFDEYKIVADSIAPERVIFRTLDSGADKTLPAQAALKEPNPALGLRGIRFCLRHEEIFKTQLRALMRAGVRGNTALLLPMITEIAEVRSVRHIIQELHKELHTQGLPHAPELPLGVMIETPAAVLICDDLAKECDFFSIGTNDLVHYLIAIDRDNRHVSYLHNPLHPAVVRAIKRVIDVAHGAGINVSVCGELASDPYGLALLLGLGVNTVSATPRFIPDMKHMIRRLDAAACTDLARNILQSSDVVESKRMVHESLYKSLGQELTFHTTSLLTRSRYEQ